MSVDFVIGGIKKTKFTPSTTAPNQGSNAVLRFTVTVRRNLSEKQRQENAAARQQNPQNPVYPHQSADFYNCVAFGNTAENINAHYNDGDIIVIPGSGMSYRTNQYQGQDGKTHYGNEFNVNRYIPSYSLVSVNQAQAIISSAQQRNNGTYQQNAQQYQQPMPNNGYQSNGGGTPTQQYQQPQTQSSYPMPNGNGYQPNGGGAPTQQYQQPMPNNAGNGGYQQAPQAPKLNQANSYQPQQNPANNGYQQNANAEGGYQIPQDNANQQYPVGITGNDLPF